MWTRRGGWMARRRDAGISRSLAWRPSPPLPTAPALLCRALCLACLALTNPLIISVNGWGGCVSSCFLSSIKQPQPPTTRHPTTLTTSHPNPSRTACFVLSHPRPRVSVTTSPGSAVIPHLRRPPQEREQDRRTTALSSRTESSTTTFLLPRTRTSSVDPKAQVGS